MNLSLTAPFTLVYLNVASYSHGLRPAWEAVAHDITKSILDKTATPSTPLLFAFVETGDKDPPRSPGWTSHHQPGPPAAGINGIGGGGITLLYHADCAVQPLPAHSLLLHPALQPGKPGSSAVLCAVIRPKHRAPFLLAVVYLPPQCAATTDHLLPLIAAIDAASAAHPSLPLLVVGDLNCHHDDWGCPMASQAASVTACARRLAEWITDSPLTICNPPSAPTRLQRPLLGGPTQQSVIDLVLSSSPALVTSVTQPPGHLHSDHLPFAVQLALTAAYPPPQPAASRPRVAWDQHRAAEAWQTCLPSALKAALAPLQPALTALSLPLPAGALSPKHPRLGVRRL